MRLHILEMRREVLGGVGGVFWHGQPLASNWVRSKLRTIREPPPSQAVYAQHLGVAVITLVRDVTATAAAQVPTTAAAPSAAIGHASQITVAPGGTAP
ncbi:uncharacterized protein RMCN_3694 [Mycolicibacterium novocastrense]|uniref:Uncharacterized protein n=1 Tax=Mycolicibacterium novocastrense TaxID=59813 RepID=A0ABQ0KLV4_MYCNV|nr:uncharacterized protein RMCN_3694 [Mycolicibacterium novocastrense]